MSIIEIIPFTTGTEAEYTIDPEIQFISNQAQLISAGTPTDYIEDFNDATGLTFGADIEIVGSAQAQLILEEDHANNFIEDFADDTDFTYNASNTEFNAGQVRQIDKTPANSLVASVLDSFNLTWSKNGSITGTQVGSPTIVGGKLECSSPNVSNYWENAAIGSASSTLSIKFKVTPLYSGSPLSNMNMFEILNGTDLQNKIIVFHGSTGAIRFSLYNSVGGLHSSALSFPTLWNPTSGQEYEFLFQINTTTGYASCYIDGIQIGNYNIGVYTRATGANRFELGAGVSYVQTNFRYDDVIMFSDIQQTGATYVTGYSIVPTIYYSDIVTLPEMSYTGPGTILHGDAFSITGAGAPRFTLQIGRSGFYLYWNGVAWAVSNNTYAQANDAATFNTNIATLPVLGEIYGQFRLYFDNSNTLSSVNELTITLTTQIYATTNPTIDIDAVVLASVSGQAPMAWNSFTETIFFAGLDAIKYTLSNDGGIIYKYWDGATWSNSAGYVQSNTGTEINTNIASFPLTASGMKIRVYLHSEDGTTTPSIGNLTVNFDDYIYPTTNPMINRVLDISTDGLLSVVEVATKTGSDEIKYIPSLNGIDYWYDAGWIVSNGTYSQSNTAAEIETNKASAIIARTDVLGVKIFLHSDDGSTTPLLNTLTLTFSYGGESPDEIQTVQISGSMFDSQGNPDSTPFQVYLDAPFVKYKTNVTLNRNIITVTPDGSGYFEIDLPETTNMEGDHYWIFQFANFTALRKVSSTLTASDFDDL